MYFLYKMIRLACPSLSLSVIIVLRIGSGLVNYPGWPWVHLRVWINWLALQSIIRYYVFPTPHIAIWINKPYVCLSINFPDKCIFFFIYFALFRFMFLKVLKKRSNAKGQTRKWTHCVFWQIYRRVKKHRVVKTPKRLRFYSNLDDWFSFNFVIYVLFEFL